MCIELFLINFSVHCIFDEESISLFSTGIAMKLKLKPAVVIKSNQMKKEVVVVGQRLVTSGDRCQDLLYTTSAT